MKTTSDSAKQAHRPANGQIDVPRLGQGGDNTGSTAHTEGSRSNGAQRRQKEKT